MTDAAGVMRKRLAIRAWRRGTREMDLVLGPYADARLAAMSASDLQAFAALLDEDDHDLYRWTTGAAAPPDRHAGLIDRLSNFARSRHRP
jgi:antitoxin CptB